MQIAQGGQRVGIPEGGEFSLTFPWVAGRLACPKQQGRIVNVRCVEVGGGSSSVAPRDRIFPQKEIPGHLIPCTGFCRSPAFEPTCHCGCEWGWVVGLYWMCWGLLQTPLLEHKMQAQLHVQRVRNEEGMCGCTHTGSLDCMFIGICHCHCQVTKLSRSRGHHHEHYFRIYS